MHRDTTATPGRCSGPTAAALLGILAVAAGCSTVAASRCDGAAAVTEVADGVFVRRGRPGVAFEAAQIANVGFIVGKRCVAVIDSGGSASEGRALDCAIRRSTRVPVCYVITTHAHPDHSLGNAAFRRDGVSFVGHFNLARALALRETTYRRRAMSASDDPLPDDFLVRPDRTVDAETEIDLGGRALSVTAHASAHTDHDVTVLDTKSGVLFAGDLVFQTHIPVLDGSLNGWIERLNSIVPAGVTHVVPGHGPPLIAADGATDATLSYLTALRDEVRDALSRGATIREAQQSIGVDAGHEWELAERHHARNVAAAFAELEWE